MTTMRPRSEEDSSRPVPANPPGSPVPAPDETALLPKVPAGDETAVIPKVPPASPVRGAARPARFHGPTPQASPVVPPPPNDATSALPAIRPYNNEPFNNQPFNNDPFNNDATMLSPRVVT